MKINEVVDNIDESYKETGYYNKYGAGELFVGINTTYQGILEYEGFHEFKQKVRKPVDTYIVLHKLANKISQEKLGLPIRSGIFTSKDKKHADTFGNTVFRMIPNDGYEAYYNPNVQDFTVEGDFKKQKRAIGYHLMSGLYDERGGPRIRFVHDFLDYLSDRSDDVDYDNFQQSIDNLFSKFSEGADEKFKSETPEVVGKIFKRYHDEIVNYVDGMVKIDDFTKAKTGYEIIIFPFNGFWFI
jgi:hypothetical protein